jgi:hypothetical protein
MDYESQNVTAFASRFGKFKLPELSTQVIKYTMSCQDEPLPEVFITCANKLEQHVLDAWTIVGLSPFSWVSTW